MILIRHEIDTTESAGRQTGRALDTRSIFTSFAGAARIGAELAAGSAAANMARRTDISAATAIVRIERDAARTIGAAERYARLAALAVTTGAAARPAGIPAGATVGKTVQRGARSVAAGIRR
jgi:hypothetical protein